MLIRYIGEYCRHFKKKNQYKLVDIFRSTNPDCKNGYLFLIFGDYGLVEMEYEDLDEFNKNWEYVYDNM